MEFGLGSNAFEVILEPFKEVLAPIPTRHVVDGFAAISGILIVVLCPLIGIIMLPLPEHSSDLKSFIDEGLIPREYLVGVNVPILHALDPVDAPVVILQGLGNMFSLVVIIRHIGVKFPSTICDWAGEESFDDVGANVVKIVFVIVDGAAEIIHVHHLASRLSAPVLVEQWVEACSA